MKQFFYLIFSIFFFVSKLCSQSFHPQDLTGIWLSENQKQKIKVEYFSDNQIYQGKIHWMYEDDSTQGRKMLDDKNPNASLRTRRVTGILLLHDFKYSGKNKFKGFIYDPTSGKDYRANLKLSSDKKKAEIRAYIVVPWIGKTEIATKVDQ